MLDARTEKCNGIKLPGPHTGFTKNGHIREARYIRNITVTTCSMVDIVQLPGMVVLHYWNTAVSLMFENTVQWSRYC